MKILIDMRGVQHAQDRGIGNYCICLIEEMLKREGRLHIEYLVDPNGMCLPRSVPGAVIHYTDRLSYLQAEYDIFFILSFFTKFDVEDVGSYLVPQAIKERCRIIAGIVYDFIPIIFESEYIANPSVNRRYRNVLKSLGQVQHLFCISETTKSDLIRFAEIEPERATVIWGSANNHRSTATKCYSYHERSNSVVYIGGDDFRKNMPDSVAAFSKAYARGLIPRDSVFYIICKVSPETRESLLRIAVKNGARGRLIVTGFIPSEMVAQILGNAKASIFPSLYEGLGMPILESYVLETPVFAGDNSSLKEITLPECLFDASSEIGLISGFVRALTDRKLCEASIEHGRAVLNDLSWERSAEVTLSTLSRLVAAREQLERFDKVAICGSLPPDENGVATFTAGLFGLRADRFAFFSASEPVQAMRHLTEISPDSPASVFPLGRPGSTRYLENAQAQVFIVGNNRFSVPVLKEAIKQRHSNVPRFAYFHDGSNLAAMYGLVDFDYHRLLSMLLSAYPEHRESLAKCDDIQEIMALDIPCFFPLLSLMHVRNAWVSTELARKRLLADIDGRMEVQVEILPLPISPIPLPAAVRYFDEDVLVIGHFGYPSPAKRLDLLARAIKIINRQRPCGLLLAGFGYLEGVALDSDLDERVRYIDSPGRDELFSAMASVDVAVQLRFPFHGESSGVIQELLALGKSVVTTRGFVDAGLSDLVFETDSDISAEGLAEAIMVAVCHKKQGLASEALSRRSANSLLGTVEKLLLGGSNETACQESV